MSADLLNDTASHFPAFDRFEGINFLCSFLFAYECSELSEIDLKKHVTPYESLRSGCPFNLNALNAGVVSHGWWCYQNFTDAVENHHPATRREAI